MIRTATTLTLLVGASLGFAACTNNLDGGSGDDTGPVDNQDSTGGTDTSFDHPNDGPSVWDIIDRINKQGPISFTSKMHACAKIKYASISNVLTGLGVNMASTTALSAAVLYKNGAASLGAPSYANRVRENIAVTTSGSSTLFDTFVAAAPEIITAMPTLEKCKVGGAPAVLFDAAGCHADGISCIIGSAASAGHVELCNLTLSRASDPMVGQRLAVAALLAAAYTCE
jgi:hypothetical protein